MKHFLIVLAFSCMAFAQVDKTEEKLGRNVGRSNHRSSLDWAKLDAHCKGKNLAAGLLPDYSFGCVVPQRPTPQQFAPQVPAPEPPKAAEKPAEIKPAPQPVEPPKTDPVKP
jgi:hypothetical protein